MAPDDEGSRSYRNRAGVRPPRYALVILEPPIPFNPILPPSVLLKLAVGPKSREWSGETPGEDRCARALNPPSLSEEPSTGVLPLPLPGPSFLSPALPFLALPGHTHSSPLPPQKPSLHTASILSQHFHVFITLFLEREFYNPSLHHFLNSYSPLSCSKLDIRSHCGPDRHQVKAILACLTAKFLANF